jgi:hypothetical protein
MHSFALFSSLHRGRALAAAIECQNPAHLAWVGVYPLDLSRATTREFLRSRGFAIFPESGWAYHVRTFEVERALVDTDVSLGEPDLINPKSFFAFDDDRLAELLENLNVSLECLELPHKSDYPI